MWFLKLKPKKLKSKVNDEDTFVSWSVINPSSCVFPGDGAHTDEAASASP